MNNDDKEKENKHQITVRLNGVDVEIEKGKYLVSELKQVLNVSAEYVLEHIKKGEFIRLDDNETIHVKKDAEFASHVPCGGSS